MVDALLVLFSLAVCLLFFVAGILESNKHLRLLFLFGSVVMQLCRTQHYIGITKNNIDPLDSENR